MLAVGASSTVVTIIETILAFAAAGVSMYLRVRGPVEMRLAYAVRAGLAIFYVGAYLWLLIHPEDRVAWSQLMQGVGMITWPAVWIFPGLIRINGRRQLKVRDHAG